METELAAAEAADIPIHVLGRYECADGGVVNPVGVLDSSLDAEVVDGHDVNGEAMSHEPAAMDDADDADIRADPNLPPSISPSPATAAYSPPQFSCLTSCSMFLRGLCGQLRHRYNMFLIMTYCNVHF